MGRRGPETAQFAAPIAEMLRPTRSVSVLIAIAALTLAGSSGVLRSRRLLPLAALSAALFTLLLASPAPTSHAQSNLETHWTATMTVDEVVTTGRGGHPLLSKFGYGSDYPDATLTANSFTYDGSTYTVELIESALGGLNFKLTPELPVGDLHRARLTLVVDGTKYPLGGAGRMAKTYKWGGGPSWSDGQMVSLSITGEGPPPFAVSQDGILGGVCHDRTNLWVAFDRGSLTTPQKKQILAYDPATDNRVTTGVNKLEFDNKGGNRERTRANQTNLAQQHAAVGVQLSPLD